MTARQTIRNLSKRGLKTIYDCNKNPKCKKELADSLVGLEVALRVDLGIFAVESWNIETGYGTYINRESPNFAPEEFPGRN